MGCAHAGPKRSAEVADRPSPSSVGLQAPDLKTQSLFRVRYQGDAGSGTLRLVLKIDDPSRYQIETKDRFGRAVWRLELSAGGTLLGTEVTMDVLQPGEFENVTFTWMDPPMAGAIFYFG